MMMPTSKRLLFTLLLLPATAGTAPAAAHDFWIQPDTYSVAPPLVVPITLQVGHGAERQRSAIPAGRITRFEAIAPDGERFDLRGDLHIGNSRGDTQMRFTKPGTYLLLLETDNRAQSRLPAKRFNDYLEAEGLALALEQRKRTHRMDADGSEKYSRRTKALVQVGPPNADTPTQITQALGLTLEIVPEVNLYRVPPPANLPVRVFYEGRPLAGARVKFTHLENDAAPLEERLTDQAGRAVFTMPKAGSWLLNVVWTKALPETSEADFETEFSSLSFGLPATRR